MFYTLLFIALTEEKHLAPEGDGHVPVDAAASSWLGSKRSQRWAGWLPSYHRTELKVQHVNRWFW